MENTQNNGFTRLLPDFEEENLYPYDEPEYTDQFETEEHFYEVENEQSPFIYEQFAESEQPDSTLTVLSVKVNWTATGRNKELVLKSGISNTDILERLKKSVDLNLIREQLLSYNRQNTSSPYPVDQSGTTVDGIFTEAIHQYQINHYLNEKDQDGIIGRSTLETMGIYNHTLKSKLDSSTFYGQKHLSQTAIRSEVERLTNSRFNAANWFQHILKPAWLGVKFTDGVHILLLEKLKEAEQWLVSQPQYSGMTPAQLGRALGFDSATRFSGARLSSEKEAMHGFGLAVDIHGFGNPWIGAGWTASTNKERTRMLQALRNASPGQSLPGQTVFQYLNNIALTQGKISTAAYDILKKNNNDFVTYLRQNRSELSYWRASLTFGDRNPLNGFLNLHRDLVCALRQVAGLAWGAIDFGPNASGDIMHFDYRTIGVGKFLCKSIAGFVPEEGHPAIEREFDNEGEILGLREREEEEAYGYERHEAIEEALIAEEDPVFEAFDHEDLYFDNQLRDWTKAITLNHRYASALGWGQYFEQINDLLLPFSGAENVSLGDEAFAEAVTAWQTRQGFSGGSADGVIGPNTWARIRPLLTVQNSPVSPVSGNFPPISKPFDFNRFHAQKVLDTLSNGLVTANPSFGAQQQLEKIVRGEKVNNVDPRTSIIQILPVMAHICDSAVAAGYADIVIGSFIRPPVAEKCTGHCLGRSIDINVTGRTFDDSRAIEMVKNILTSLTSLPDVYRKGRIGFGLPLQSDFFGRRKIAKFKSVSPTLIINQQIKQLIPQLGYVFPDNDNHLHIQVGWI
ncbi:hypothetical protein [Dyadobacter sp. LHD-138]|uniref:hypothetical protein n=1 Tax=Dyadobacter sp. LHD-138 TaxID=3071413 RepID=UPI0027DF9830|nr:hypothetical protein [Dyadobacter sp. LHD-138]MDQ6477265.1 hypothetical protein [Dyadobacter sp. LHD-138]